MIKHLILPKIQNMKNMKCDGVFNSSYFFGKKTPGSAATHARSEILDTHIESAVQN